MGLIGPFWVIADRIEAKYVQLSSHNIQNSRMLVEGVIKLAGTPLGSFGNSIEPKRRTLGQRRAFWGAWLGVGDVQFS